MLRFVFVVTATLTVLKLILKLVLKIEKSGFHSNFLKKTRLPVHLQCACIHKHKRLIFWYFFFIFLPRYPCITVPTIPYLKNIK